MRGSVLIPALLLTGWMVVGCAGPPEPLPEWGYGLSPNGEAAKMLDPRRDAQPRIQVIIVYNAGGSNHSALRITSATHPPVFWDPGGGYRDTKPPTTDRRNDVLVQDAPSLATYRRHRLRTLRDDVMKVMEWDLPEDEAHALQRALVDGSKGLGDFRTGVGGGACTIATAAFLQLHRPAGMHVPQRWLFPHNLAEHLWTQRPTRVMLCRNGGDTLYEPGSMTARASTSPDK